MIHIKHLFKLGYVLVLNTLIFTSCLPDTEVGLSFSIEEMDATIQDDWVVKAAGYDANYFEGEEHVEPKFESRIDYITITKEAYIIHFKQPTKIIIMEPNGEIGVEETITVTEYTLKHDGQYQNVTSSVEFITDFENPEDPFLYYNEGYVINVENLGEHYYGNCVSPYLYGKSSDESQATEIVLDFGFYYSLVRK